MDSHFEHARKAALGCLAMSSCAFVLWTSQVTSHASTTNEPTTIQLTAATTEDQSQLPVIQNEQATTDTTADQQEQNINWSDQGNHAYLDHSQLNENGELTVSGWHATNQSQDRPYHYIIAFDPTNNREIARQNITGHEVSRPDVQQHYNVYGAAKSGFNTTFQLADKIADLNSVQIISRYTTDPAGNGNYVDYWFAPIVIDRSNNGHLDNVAVDEDQLQVTGWHATNLAADKPYHYVIVFDQTADHEVARQLLTTTYDRPDVTSVFPGIYHSTQSGFRASFNLADINLNHTIQILDRYSKAADGNSQYVDFWFPAITNDHEANEGHLDSYQLADGQHLTVTGWHAANLSQFEKNHFLILYDNTANRQVGVINAITTARPDVERAYPAIFQASQSGFTGSFDLASNRLTVGHTYFIVSRYSTTSHGNGDQGQYTDYWLTPFTISNEAASHFDGIQMLDNGLQINGWMVSNQSLSRPYAYAIVMNDGHEVTRARLNLQARPDVTRYYDHVYNSLNSGFSQLIQFNPNQITGNMQVILRFTNDPDDPDGNGNYVDQWSQSYASNDGYFDQIQVNADSIYVQGWHASDQSAGKPYHWLIFIDRDGHELYRQQVLDINNARPDLANNRSYILGADHAGYKLWFNIPNQLQHHVVRIIHRITDDPAGNGHFVDLWSDLVDINAYHDQLINRWQQIARSFGMPVSIAIQLANTGEVINFTNVPGQTFVTASTVKVSILAKLLHNQGGNLNGYQQGVAARMIEVSDNDCATELYHEIGSQAGLNQFFRELGMNSSYCDGRWGLTTTTAMNQLKLLHEIFLNPNSTYLNRQAQQTIQQLMAQVTPSQRWGISAGSSNYYIKNGWNIPYSTWNVSSIGYIPGKYTIAIYTGNSSFDRGRAFIEQLAAATRQIVG